MYTVSSIYLWYACSLGQTLSVVSCQPPVTLTQLCEMTLPGGHGVFTNIFCFIKYGQLTLRSICTLLFNRHKNVQVRKTTAQFLLAIVEKMGPGRILSGIKDVTDRIIPAIAQFSMDNTPETR